MTCAAAKVLFVQTFYPEFLSDLYAAEPGLGDLDFDPQRRRLFDTFFANGDAYSHGLNVAGCDAAEVICNADLLQARWGLEHDLELPGNIHDRRRRILAAQIEHYRPDVLYVFEWSPLGDGFLADVKRRVGLLVGQIASPLPPNRTFAAYDLMISSWPPIVDYFRRHGMAAEPLKLGFDLRVLDRLQIRPLRYDVTFVGGFAPSHADRISWLERLLQDIDIEVFGYGIEKVPEGSPIHDHHRGPVWGWRMYETLQRSRITLNRHARIDVRGSVNTSLANNMRLYEATGVGACLVTEDRENLHEVFEPDQEVVIYRNTSDCVEKIRYYLAREAERAAIARAGQSRTCRDHSYVGRMGELAEVLRHHLRIAPCVSRR